MISTIAGIIIGMINTSWPSVLVASLFWGWAAYGYGRIAGYYKFGTKRFAVEYLMELMIAAVVGSITFFVKGLWG